MNQFTAGAGPAGKLLSVEAEPPLAELWRHERRFTLPALEEAIRLLRSDKFGELTSEQIHAVGEYRSIEIGDESFFDKAFTPGKEAAASLGYARCVGRRLILEDLQRLRATLRATQETGQAPSG